MSEIGCLRASTLHRFASCSAPQAFVAQSKTQNLDAVKIQLPDVEKSVWTSGFDTKTD